MSRLDAVVQYFSQRPNEWIDAAELAGVGGRFAWRTRVSEARRAGMNIVNRTAKARTPYGASVTLSHYRYEKGVTQ